MGLYKFGVGYRLSPRTEVAANVVISRSSSEPISIGTVGTANVPLVVKFDDYNYWGVEGGQRFFFSRVRFTPFVGYLVGINRHGDIRGVFVGVPPSLTPGLVAQDGKFFEKSWAFSFGPTGGVLVGIGPIRSDGRDATAFHGRTLGCRLAGRGGPARHQQRERALVVAAADRRADPVLTPRHEPVHAG